MKVHIVLPSIGKLNNVFEFKDQFLNSEHDIIINVIDEGDETNRKENEKLLEELEFAFYGPKERAEWFKARFGNAYEEKLSVIPERCHAETSFGFLLAIEDTPDIVIELDDDVFPVDNHDLINMHIENLSETNAEYVESESGWYNTLDALSLVKETSHLYPRGHPYTKETRIDDYQYSETKSKSVVNMGHWIGNLDFDAPTLLYNGGLDGRYIVEGMDLAKERVIVAPGVLFAVCSMNTSFVPEVIPGFYQLYMNYNGIDRFDDIWSGLFVKKCADTLGDSISIGKPLGYHNKRPRSVFKDLRSELEGIVMNEHLWTILSSIDVHGSDYTSCYSSLVDGIESHLDDFTDTRHHDFIKLQIQKMRLWLDVIDKIS